MTPIPTRTTNTTFPIILRIILPSKPTAQQQQRHFSPSQTLKRHHSHRRIPKPKPITKRQKLFNPNTPRPPPPPPLIMNPALHSFAADLFNKIRTQFREMMFVTKTKQGEFTSIMSRLTDRQGPVMDANWWIVNLLIAVSPAVMLGLYFEFVAKPEMMEYFEGVEKREKEMFGFDSIIMEEEDDEETEREEEEDDLERLKKRMARLEKLIRRKQIDNETTKSGIQKRVEQKMIMAWEEEEENEMQKAVQEMEGVSRWDKMLFWVARNGAKGVRLAKSKVLELWEEWEKKRGGMDMIDDDDVFEERGNEEMGQREEHFDKESIVIEKGGKESVDNDGKEIIVKKQPVEENEMTPSADDDDHDDKVIASPINMSQEATATEKHEANQTTWTRFRSIWNFLRKKPSDNDNNEE